jgi:site-specific recombinase XerD
MGKAPFQYIDFMHLTHWLIDPEGSYANWQAEEAAGADRRPFAEQSIVQHRAMFSRFHRYLSSRGQTVATFGADHVDGFLIHIAPDCADGTTTQIRYLKLIDRLTRRLVDVGVRQENPAAMMLLTQSWPEDEPTPVYLSFEDDERLQRSLVVPDGPPFKIIRNKAVVALLAASGITSAELKRLKRPDLDVGGTRPDVAVAKSGARLARKVPIDAFALEVLTAYLAKRNEMSCASEWLFVSTASGKPVKDDTLGQCVRHALAEVDVAAADMSPRLLRNTYCRRHLRAGKTNEQVSSLLGLSSHRTAVRIRQTIEMR